MNQAGIYQVDARIQAAADGSFQVFVNGAQPSVLNGGAVPTAAGGTAIIPTILTLNAGDVISIVNGGNVASSLLGVFDGLITANTALRIIKLD
ncbi:hypothetical protein HNR77_006004 [Paenibacillus sp. JGP012]|nr:hypothetical protein [Paenibacillus sp. JGP012]